MANINYIPQVKTAVGFDTLNTVSQYTNHVATACTTVSDTYNINVIAPVEILTGQFMLLFTPSSDNLAGMKININNMGVLPIYVDASAIGAGLLKSGIPTQLLVDETLNRAYVRMKNYDAEIAGMAGSVTTFSTDGNTITKTMSNGDTLVTVFNPNGSITETFTANGNSIVKNTVFNPNGSITEVLV